MAKVAKGATAQTMGHLSANLKVDGADLVKRIKVRAEFIQRR